MQFNKPKSPEVILHQIYAIKFALYIDTLTWLQISYVTRTVLPHANAHR